MFIVHIKQFVNETPVEKVTACMVMVRCVKWAAVCHAPSGPIFVHSYFPVSFKRIVLLNLCFAHFDAQFFNTNFKIYNNVFQVHIVFDTIFQTTRKYDVFVFILQLVGDDTSKYALKNNNTNNNTILILLI